MFTTGSKLFVGGALLALIGTFIYAAAHGGPLGVIGLVSAVLAMTFLAGINFWVRDSNVSSMDTPGIARSAAAQPAPANSMWPLIGGAGAAVLALGFVVGKAITWLGIIILLVTIFEWMVQSWSERASADPVYNNGIRKRLLNPIEFPVLGAVGLGMIIFSFSRIVIRLPETGRLVAFGGLATVVLLFGALLAAKRSFGRALVTALCAVGLVGVVGAGVASAVAGHDKIPKHETATYSNEADNCGAEATEADDASSQAIAAKSNMVATIVLENGKLRADAVGVPDGQPSVTLQRSNPSLIRFINRDPERRRLVADLGVEITNAGTADELKVPVKYCTQLTRQDGVQFLTFKAKQSSVASGQAFAFTVPGLDGQSVEIVVP